MDYRLRWLGTGFTYFLDIPRDNRVGVGCTHPAGALLISVKFAVDPKSGHVPAEPGIPS